MSNNAVSAGLPTTLYASLSSAAAGSYGSFEVPSGAPVSTWPTVYPFTVTIDWGNSSFEAVAVTGPYTGTGPYTYPCIRGFDGTSAVAHTAPAATVVPGISGQDTGSAAVPMPGPPSSHNIPWLVVDDTGAAPVIRLGAGGPAWRTTGYNFWIAHPSEGATITTGQIDELFARLRPGSLLRVWAYPTNPSTMTWATLAASYLDVVVAAAKKYGHRCIFTLTTWADGSEYLNTSGFTDITGTTGEGVKTVAWITSQQYLHSVFGANSLQDWVTFLVQRYAAEPTVCIYDLMNEPNDGTATNVTAWATYCSTVSGWIKAIAPGALVYIASADAFALVDSVAHYETVIASMDLSGEHDYATSGFSWLGLASYQGVINKPMLSDEYGHWAKGHYGAYTDTDLDDNGLPAMTWEAQARMTEIFLESVFRNPSCFAALAWDLEQLDADNAPYSAYAGLGIYTPLNQSRTHKVIKDFPVTDHPAFTINTVASMVSWINGAQALRYPDGQNIWSGANALQQVIYDLVALGEYTGPGTQALGPVARHRSVLIRNQDWPTLQFTGSATSNYFSPATWNDTGTATFFFVIYPTALPTGSGNTTFGYLVAPSTNVAAAAVRITSTGAVTLEEYSAATGGSVAVTSTATLTANQPALVMAQYVSGSSYRVDVNTVIANTGGTARTYTNTGAFVFGAAADTTNGFTGHLLEAIKYTAALSEAQISTVNAYLTRKYGLQS
jgi:hypothetical protein